MSSIKVRLSVGCLGYLIIALAIALGVVIGLLISGFLPSPSTQNNIQAAHVSFPLEYANSTLILENITLHRGTGISMQPGYFTGNLMIVIPYTGQELREGQIIRYYDPEFNINVSHRIKGKYKNYVITQADFEGYESKVYLNQANGVVIGVLYT